MLVANKSSPIFAPTNEQFNLNVDYVFVFINKTISSA